MSRRSSARAKGKAPAAAAVPMREVLEAVLTCTDGDGRQRCELFLQLPERVEPPERIFPSPLSSLPEDLAAGSKDQLRSDGTLPSMSKKLPTESTLRTWTRESQVAFWEQRRAAYNRVRSSCSRSQLCGSPSHQNGRPPPPPPRPLLADTPPSTFDQSPHAPPVCVRGMCVLR